MKKLKIGLIGCGIMMKQHVLGADQIQSAEIVAVCDIIRERAEEVATVLNNPFITTDWRELTDKVDAVLIALPHDLHYECGVYFARNKKHVLMEKPLCNSEEECRSLIDICNEEGVTLMCAYPVPHYPAVRKLKEFIDSGEFGKVMQFSVWTEQLTITDEVGWGSTARLGGGQFFSHGCHYVDLLLRMLGTPVKGFHVGTRNGTPWLRKEGTSAVIFEFENGALGYHGATWGARGTQLGWRIQVQTEKGMLEYVKTEGAKIKFYNKEKVHIPGTPVLLDGGEKEYQIIWDGEKSKGSLKYTYLEIDHFAECVATGRKPITDGESALKSLQVIWELYDGEKHNIAPDLRKYAYTEEDRENYKNYIDEMNEIGR